MRWAQAATCLFSKNVTCLQVSMCCWCRKILVIIAFFNNYYIYLSLLNSWHICSVNSVNFACYVLMHLNVFIVCKSLLQAWTHFGHINFFMVKRRTAWKKVFLLVSVKLQEKKTTILCCWKGSGENFRKRQSFSFH